jgi:hypothetical protein
MTTISRHCLTSSYFRQLAASVGLEPEQLFREWAESADLNLTGVPSHDRIAVLHHNFPARDGMNKNN